MQASYIKSLLRKQSKEEPVKLVAGLEKNISSTFHLSDYRVSYLEMTTTTCTSTVKNVLSL